MSRGGSRKKQAAAVRQPGARQSLPVRQRQRLIDACITALHLYGPSGTTVARVVAIARLSPGIVRFYFQSKAAMLVASLQYLATEFEERVLTPVYALRGQPALALQRLVDLYLDPEIASPRKVAVWYAFWGEASARQEYLAICGQKDANFAALVHDLVDRMVASSGRRHLDSEAVALGLIGVLEMLWQGFAFEEEASIDRALARRRCMAYLRSVFPREFGPPDGGTATAPLTSTGPDDQAGERQRVFRGAWQFTGHEHDIPCSGDFVTRELVESRVLLLRDTDGAVRAFRNACRHLPHALVTARRGRFADGRIACALHGLVYGIDGRAAPAQAGVGLQEFDVHRCGGLVFVRSPAATHRWPVPDLSGLEDVDDHRPTPDSAGSLLPVEADWKIVMLQLLESRPPGATAAAGRRHFIWPNLLLEQRPGVLSILQVLPAAAGHSRVQQFDYLAPSTATESEPGTTQAGIAAARELLERELVLAASTQQGQADPDYAADPSTSWSPAAAAFRGLLRDAEY